jgi:multiple sugar transport system ATP-binding protein
VRRVAALLSLEDLLRRKPRELSGGQRQRVALGRAIVRRPKVFLMDEPLSNLDARLRVEMRAELKKLHQELRITTVYVTHDQEEAMTLSDRIAVLMDGRMPQCGAPMDVYARPANLFVAGFVGSPPMSFLEGKRLQAVPFLTPLLAAQGGGDVTVGIRPSDVTVRAGAGVDALAARVLLLEPTGSEVWVDGMWEGMPLKGRLAPGEKVVPGTEARFEIAPERLHFFDTATGERRERKEAASSP